MAVRLIANGGEINRQWRQSLSSRAAKSVAEGGKICRPRDQGKDYMTPHQTFMVSHIKYNPNRSLAPNCLLTDLGLICLNCLRYEWTSQKKLGLNFFCGGTLHILHFIAFYPSLPFGNPRQVLPCCYAPRFRL